MAVVVAPAVHDDGVSHPDTTEPARTTASPRFRLALAGVLALALVGSLIWLGVVLVGNADGDTASREGDRATVVLRAKEWMGAFGRFDKEDLDNSKVLTGYRDRLEPLVATGFTCYGLDLDQTIAATSQLVAQSKVSTSTTVDRAGVQAIDDDSATVIISGIRESAVAKSGAEQRPYQMLVDLQKIDGSWVVSRCNDVDSRFKK